MQIDIISDAVCPWCFIGKRNLEKSLETYASQYPDADAPQVRWHPFQLNPSLAAGGIPRAEYTSSKFGGAERAREIYRRVTDAGTAAGIEFHFDDIKVQPNTVDAHQLILLAGQVDAQDGVVESLFEGFFLEGRNLADRESLLDLAHRGGLPRADAERCLTEQLLRKTVEEQDEHARKLGVEGVPFFVFDNRLAVSGAQPPEILIQALSEAASQPPVGGQA
jgi:predicted DsbA family dithiol-disulfide isomerase